MHGIAIGSQEKFSKNVQSYIKFLQVKISRRSEGNRGVFMELPWRVSAFEQSSIDCNFAEYPPSALDVLTVFYTVSTACSAR